MGPFVYHLDTGVSITAALLSGQKPRGGLGTNERKDGEQGAEPRTSANRTSHGGNTDLLPLSSELTSLTLLKGTQPSPH